METSSSNEPLTIEQLITVLNITPQNVNIKNINESIFKQYKTKPNFASLLLTISCNNQKQYSPEIELNAAIQLKNFIRSFWKFTDDPQKNKAFIFNDDEIIIISQSDKDFIRFNIIDAIIYEVLIENAKVLKQLNQCIKTILKFDFDTSWKDMYLSKLLALFQSGNEKQTYAGIILLHQLSKHFQFLDEQQLAIYNNTILVKVNDYLISFMQQCNDLTNRIQVQFGYKILKVFMKSLQCSIPDIFTNVDIYNKWSEFIIKVIQTPIENSHLNSNDVFWKIKELALQIIKKVYQKTLYPLKKGNNNQQKEMFKELILTKYAYMYFTIMKNIYSNENAFHCYLNDKCLIILYNYFSDLIMNNSDKSEEVVLLFINNDKLKMQLIKDAMLTNEEIDLYNNDIKTYLNRQLDELANCFTKRHKAAMLMDAMMQYCPLIQHDNNNNNNSNNNNQGLSKQIPKYFEMFYMFLIATVTTNTEHQKKETEMLVNTNSNNKLPYKHIEYNLIKESIMYIMTKCNETIIEYSSTSLIETFIYNFVLPELQSPIGLMREKACIFISKYQKFSFKDTSIVQTLTTIICGLLEHDMNPAAKISSAIAASALLKQPHTKNLLKNQVKILTMLYLKLIEESEIEEIVTSLQKLIVEFHVEIKEFIVQLSGDLIRYFNKLISRENTEGDDEKGCEDCFLINNIISTFQDIVSYYIQYPETFAQLEKDVIVILNYCIKQELVDKLEEGLDILNEILKKIKTQTLSEGLWSFFIPLIESVIGHQSEIADFRKQFPTQIFQGYGFEYIYDITKMIIIYIMKDPYTFISNKQYFESSMQLVERVVEICVNTENYSSIKYAFEIFITLLDVYKGQCDAVHMQIMNFVFNKINNIASIKSDTYMRSLHMLLSACYAYDAVKSNEMLIGCGSEMVEKVFRFWFGGLDDMKRLREMKVGLIGLCGLMLIPPGLQMEVVRNDMKVIIGRIKQVVFKVNEKRSIEEKNNELHMNGKTNINDVYEKLNKFDFDDEDDDVFEEDEDSEDDDEDDLNEDEELIKICPTYNIDNNNSNKINLHTRENELIVFWRSLQYIMNNYNELYQFIITCIGEEDLKQIKAIVTKEEQKYKQKQ